MKFISTIIACFIAFSAFSQASLEVTVKDQETGEGLIAASVLVGTKGYSTDVNGQIIIDLPPQTYKVVISYVGFNTFEKEVDLKVGKNTLVVELESQSFQEVILTADIAIDRKTPVSYSNIETKQLTEELASQDLPMILNSTPGAYATQSGGGDGDARINIRGFDQRNVAVMLDGVPVNDMENGWVYWSNWFGLDLVTKTMQVQRGLGASKLSLPSVGGTINILTRGIAAKKGLRFRQEVGTGGFTRSTLGLTTGRLNNGFGMSMALSYKQGNGWVDGTFTKGYFYYLRVDKTFGNHMVSFSGFGAPQEHGQRPFRDPIALFSADYARDLGIEETYIDDVTESNIVSDVGRRFNPHVGILNGEQVNVRKNFYHKPQISLRHSWNASKRFYLSNVAYLSIGNGGGTAPNTTMIRRSDGYFDLDSVYSINSTPTFLNPDGRASYFLRANRNNHFWYGVLSNAQFTINSNWTLSGGIDLRDFQADHYREIYDLLGGSYYADNLQVGDRFLYDNTSYIQWAGAFSLLEYQKDKWSLFFNASAAHVRYRLDDHLKQKAVYLSDTTLYFNEQGSDITYTNPTTNETTTYTPSSPEARNQFIDWVTRPSFTFKTGASYKINDAHSVFFNTGYLSRPTRYTNLIQEYRTFYNGRPEIIQDAENEIIYAFEGGYQYRSSFFSANVNAYWTNWINRPLDRVPTVLEDPSDPESDRIPVNINGIAALHRGIEVDFAYKPFEQLNIQGLLSLGDWIWNSSGTVILPDGSTYTFDPQGVHVGDAAQIQAGLMVRYEPIDKLFFRVRSTYFAKNFANFSPEALRDATARTESWQMPNYLLTDFHSGYAFKFQETNMSVRLSVLNLFDTFYISDANNNDSFTQTYNEFDAKSASVFFGMGRRWNASIQISL